jgi:two-component system sensor histidine kinase/response regulator
MAHVLLLEPNTLLARTFADALQTAGHTVAVVRGAQRAVHTADEQRPDVVILELQLPEHNGIEFLHEFRSYPEWQHIPVVINTSLPPAMMRQYLPALAQDLGVQTVLYKATTTLADLLRIVHSEVAATP